MSDGILSVSEMAEIVYRTYPRHVGKRVAIRAITFALTRVHDGEVNQKPMDWPEVYKFMVTKVRQYADSPAGNRETLTPHPSTFFNQSRYMDHEVEWYRMTVEETKQLARANEANIGVWRPQ